MSCKIFRSRTDWNTALKNLQADVRPFTDRLEQTLFTANKWKSFSSKKLLSLAMSSSFLGPPNVWRPRNEDDFVSSKRFAAHRPASISASATATESSWRDSAAILATVTGSSSLPSTSFIFWLALVRRTFLRGGRTWTWRDYGCRQGSWSIFTFWFWKKWLIAVGVHDL